MKKDKRSTPVKKSQADADAGFAAMDLTRDDRVVFGYGSQINFLGKDSDNLVQGWKARHKRDERQTFSPRKLLLHDRSAKTILLSPSSKNVVSYYDTETGTPLAELGIKNTIATEAMPIDTLVPDQKFQQLLPHDVIENVAISGNMVFKLTHDMRMKGEEVVITEKSEVPGKRGARFTAVATTGSGDVVVGMNTGEVKLYAKPSENGWTRAKTNLNQLSAPVTGVDVSFDGQWVLWTTKEFLALMNVKFTDEKSGRDVTGFEKSMPTDQRASCLILRLSEEQRSKFDIKEVNFMPGKFDTGPSNFKPGTLEDHIVTSTGPWIVSWNLRLLKLDYEKHRKSDQIETGVVPRIAFQEHPILDNQFEYGDSDVVVTATAEELSRLALSK
jgi:hypothetical protein